MLTFEQDFRDKCECDDNLRLLRAQWDFDKEWLTRALSAVPLFFPHYSRHDASHAATLLANIGRILGPDRIARLSATDLWLLLESAYWHDVGMVIDSRQAREWWPSPEFRAHCRNLENGNDQVLARAAWLLRDREHIANSDDNWPLDVRQAATFLLADYARSKHADRAELIVSSPQLIGLETPRGLIPDRLIRYLGSISRCHGCEFSTLMVRLPQVEQGLGLDDCHPRMIGALLRLGDLLDLDNGRFCPVLSSTLTLLPSTTVDHVQKHASIRKLLITPERIDVEAICDRVPDAQNAVDVDPFGAYAAISDWLEALQNELRSCATKWGEISPPDFGGPPGIGTITANLVGFVPLVPGDWPRFGIDEEAFTKLAQGSNLYKTPKDAWLAELLANACDATLLRVWAEASDEERELMRRPKENSDAIAILKAKLVDYPIRIEFAHLGFNETYSLSKWRFTIRDHGIGITMEDLRNIRVIGGSHRNAQRRAVIQEMPEYVKPQGSFGLGLQSVFYVTDSITIITRSFHNAECWRVSLENGKWKIAKTEPGKLMHRRAGVYVQPARPGDTDVPRPSGTALSFEFELPSIPGQLQVTTRVGRSIPSHSFDVIVDKHLPFEIAKWLEEVTFQSQSMLCSVVTDCAELNRDVYWAEDADQCDDIFWYFDCATNIRIGFRSLPSLDTDVPYYRPELDLRYRGRHVTTDTFYPALLWTCADLYFGDARDFVTVSREDMTAEGKEAIQKVVASALSRALGAYLTYLRQQIGSLRDGRTLARASLWCLLRQEGNSEPRLTLDLHTIGTDWRNCSELADDRQGQPAIASKIVSTLQDKGKVIVRTVSVTGAISDLPLPAEYDSYEVFIVRKDTRAFNETGYAKSKALRRLLRTQGGYEQLFWSERKVEPSADMICDISCTDFLVSIDRDIDPLSDAMFQRRLQELASSWAFFGVNCVRQAFPCQHRYRVLAVAAPKIVGPIAGDLDMVFTECWMLLPFELQEAGSKGARSVVTCNHLGRYVRWVAESAKEQSLPPAQRQVSIAKATLAFIEETLPILRGSVKHEVKADMASVQLQLSDWLNT